MAVDISIVCPSSVISMLPIRLLVQQLNLEPREMYERAGYAFLHPLHKEYDEALLPLSLLERVPDRQILGIASQWRVSAWLTAFAQLVAAALKGRRILFYTPHCFDKATCFFIDILSKYVPAGAITVIIDTEKKSDEHDHIISSREHMLIALLEQSSDTLSPGDGEYLRDCALSCVVRAQYWQAQVIYEKLKECNDPAAYHGLGLVYRFNENYAAAEWYYTQAMERYHEQKNVAGYVYAAYARSLLHLRFYPAVDRQIAVAEFCINSARSFIEEIGVSGESGVYLHLLIYAADGLVEYRKNKLPEALETCDVTFALLESLPDSERKKYVFVFNTINKARVLIALDQHEEACDLRRQAVELDPQLSFWWVEYVRTLLILQRYDEALSEVRRGIALHPDCPLLKELEVECREKSSAARSIELSQCARDVE